MFQLTKNESFKNYLFFKSKIINLNIFFIDFKLDIPNSISCFIYKKKLFLKNENNNCFLKNEKVFFFKKKKILFFTISEKKKKKLYKQLVFFKIKGLLQKFKVNLNLIGIGFKVFIKNNKLILKLGYSHNIIIEIPSNIKILNKNSKLILYSIDFVFLTQFVFFVKSFKFVEPYKGKGLTLNSEIILRKEGKKSKK